MSVEPLIDKMGSSASVSAPVSKTETAITVACYNVYFKGYDRPGTIDGIFMFSNLNQSKLLYYLQHLTPSNIYSHSQHGSGHTDPSGDE